MESEIKLNCTLNSCRYDSIWLGFSFRFSRVSYIIFAQYIVGSSSHGNYKWFWYFMKFGLFFFSSPPFKFLILCFYSVHSVSMHSSSPSNNSWEITTKKKPKIIIITVSTTKKLDFFDFGSIYHSILDRIVVFAGKNIEIEKKWK